MLDPEPTSAQQNHDFAAMRSAEQFEAGYAARFQDVAEYLSATPCWRSGWQEADRELVGSAPAARFAPGSDAAPLSLFGTGTQARVYELPFDELCPDIWKKSWVQADIDLGLAARRLC